MLQPFYQKDMIEAGCDEAGRGCLAGPVFAASVILPKDYQNSLLTDSKQLSHKKRELLRHEIESEAIAFAVAEVDNLEIDKINILNASILAMHKAIDMLSVKPEFLIIDGNRFHKFRDVEHKCIVKGDSLYLNIAAASILAKTYRDDYMNKIHTEFPEYSWHKNKGYPTKAHRQAIGEFGQTKYHRLSFRLTDTQMKLF